MPASSLDQGVWEEICTLTGQAPGGRGVWGKEVPGVGPAEAGMTAATAPVMNSV